MTIPYSRQSVSEEDIAAVVSVMRSDYLTQGQVLVSFEKNLNQMSHSEYAVAVNSATSALHIACLALDVGPGDVVWTTPITYVATANCARLCGADVDFVDIDLDTFNMSPVALEQKLIKAKAENRLPKAIIPVHMCGQSADMEKIRSLTEPLGIHLIEDASHAIGASYKGYSVGSCKYSDITIFSFHPVKIITTGEGGAALTNDYDLSVRMRELRSHGVTRDSKRMRNKSGEAWRYDQIQLGLNYRMTEIQAALGRSQLSRLHEFVDRRNELAQRYQQLLSNFPLHSQSLMTSARSSYHLYVIRLMEKAKRRFVFDSLRKAGVGVNVHYIPVHTQPYYNDLGFVYGDFPVSEGYYESAISIPIYPTMTHNQQDTVVDELSKAFDKCSNREL